MPRYSIRIGNRTVPVATTDRALSEAIGKRFARGDPATNVDATGGGHRYSFGGQELTFDDLRDIKDMRDSGGQVAQLMEFKGLLNFGEGAEIHVEASADDEEMPTEIIDGEEKTLEEHLEEDLFPNIDLQVLDLGKDALWYPCAVGEIQETVTGDFKRALPAEPWTVIPITNGNGEVEAYRQRTKSEGGGYDEHTLPGEDLWHIVVNKSSARDETGISEVLRNRDEIQAFKENEEAIRNAIELHGFPQRHVKVGREDGAPVSDDDLRRVRTIFDPRTSDANTAYFTGQDVDVQELEAEQFDYEAIHEMDMRNLTTALGLPLEAGNVGSDGLGSGKPAELRFALLKLVIKANQRSFSTQFVERVMRPVIRDYSPFDHTANITLAIDDPLEDIGETAELIQKVGDYMTNDEVRRRLDLPEPEDDEIGESFQSPAQAEAPEDEGGPFGGGDGLFRDGADGRTLAEVPDNAVSISDRSEAPEGANVITGPGGGLYYVPGGEGEGGASGDNDAASVDDEIRDSVTDREDYEDAELRQRVDEAFFDEEKTEAVEAHLSESLDVERVNIDNVDRIDSSAGHSYEDTLIGVAEELTRLEGAGHLENVNEVDVSKKFTEDGDGPTGAVAMYYHEPGPKIDRERSLMINGELLDKYVDEDREMAEDVVAHEAGHALQWQAFEDGRLDQDAMRRDLSDKEKQLVEDELSGLAASHRMEFFAEAYLEVVRGGELSDESNELLAFYAGERDAPPEL